MTPFTATAIRRDFAASIVVFLVALPLCLGIALASNAPLISGIISGIVGGLIVGMMSGSHTLVSGPAAGLTAVVAAQIGMLGDFRVFLLAVVIAGVFQLALGFMRAGIAAAFMPTTVINGLLFAIGVILVLKQIPHVFGHDTDPEGEMAFSQPDHENTLSELWAIIQDLHVGAATIGVLSIALLVLWSKWKWLKKSAVPAPVVVVLLGLGLRQLFEQIGAPWAIGASHLVQVPVMERLADLPSIIRYPDFSQWLNADVYRSALIIAAVASLETLLNLEAVDKLDPLKRVTPPNRELVAQGTGNLISGLIGGIPITGVIVRSSANIDSGAKTKLSAISHGALLLFCVVLMPTWLNRIPLSCLGGILLVTGFKLASPHLVKQMWNGGRYQFTPFILTVLAIVLTDLLMGVLLGIAVSVGFILNSNLRRPLRKFVEKHLGGEVLRIELANQVSFLNRAVLAKTLNGVPPGWHVLLDARGTDYVEPDVLTMIREFKESSGPARNVQVSLLGFRDKYHLRDETHYVDYSTRELQAALTPEQVLTILREGNQRFRSGQRLTRDLGRQVGATAAGQHPLAVVLSCIDSRTPSELIFDLGLGDIFSVRIAGNVISERVLGSIEYACAMAGAKLVLVLGHTRCGAVTAAVQSHGAIEALVESTGCQHLTAIMEDIQSAMSAKGNSEYASLDQAEQESIVNAVARRNVYHSTELILQRSGTVAQLAQDGKIAVMGAMYDVTTGAIDFLSENAPSLAENQT